MTDYGIKDEHLFFGKEAVQLLEQIDELFGQLKQAVLTNDKPFELIEKIQAKHEAYLEAVKRHRRSAITDFVTGVYNTLFFYEVLRRETARADRYTTPLSLLMVDIDTFKLINDTFGHGVGNRVLSQ